METELVALQEAGSLGRDVGALGEAAITSFYEDMKAQHEREASQARHFGGTPSRTRANSCSLYLDEDCCKAAAAASRQYLENHSDLGSLGFSDLRARVALQHFTSIDVEDLHLPVEKRRTNDSFAEDGICDQFLLDAGRSTFVLRGVEFHFASECEATGLSRDEDALQVEELLVKFQVRLVDALKKALGEHPPEILVRAVSRSMSQSGMANVERAVPGPQIVVSSGDQILRYELHAISADVWEVRMYMCKEGFEQFVVVEEGCSEEPGKVMVVQCSPDSKISQSCTLRFELFDSDLQVHVCDMDFKSVLLDSSGNAMSPVDSNTQQMERSWKDILSVQMLVLTWHSALASLLYRCSRCRRRARHAASAVSELSSGISLPVLPKNGEPTGSHMEDPENSMTTPLRELP